MIMEIPKLFHPLLFSFFPTFYVYSQNIHVLMPTELLLPLLVISGSTVIGFIILEKILKNKIKVALILTLFLVLFFSYGHIYNILNDFTAEGFDLGKHRYLLIPFTAIFVSGIIYFLKTKRKLDNVTKITNVMSVAIMLIISMTVITNVLEGNFYGSQTLGYEEKMLGMGSSQEFNPNDLFSNPSSKSIIDIQNMSRDSNLPDIYYIIPDEYGSYQSLKEFFDYDNSDFVNYLKQRGFFVNEKSFANYPRTIQSVSSSLNMEYLDKITEQAGINSKSYHLLNEHVSNNKVMSNMKSRDYIIVNVGSFWGPNMGFAKSDVNLCEFKQINSNSLMNELLLSSMLGYIQERLTEQGRRDAILCTFDELYTINEKIPKQKFVFAHIQLPHSPFIFGPNGEHVTPGIPLNSSKWDERKAHVDQIEFANKKLKILIDKLLESEEKPIIILQGDTGSLYTGDFSESSIITIRERLSNLNAIYIPDEKYDLFYDGITPVNTFRIIENTVFNGDYLLLKDKTYWSIKDTPNNYEDVTNHLLN